MNPDLYTDEFRNFKYLKSTPDAVKYFKLLYKEINSIQPPGHTDVEFVWPDRIEFLEQLFDCEDQTLFVVYPNTVTFDNMYDGVSIIEIKNPVIYAGDVITPHLTHRVDESVIPDIEANNKLCYWLVPKTIIEGGMDGPRVRLHELPLIPRPTIGLSTAIFFTALFTKKETAELYSVNLTAHIRQLGRMLSNSGT